MPTITRKQKPTKNRPFDWDIFLDGAQRTCVQGADFTGPLFKFQQRARHAAQRRGRKAVTWTDGSEVIIQFVTKTSA